MYQIPLNNLPLSYKKIKKEIDPAIKHVIDSGEFILGKELQQFEDEFAKYLGAKYCLGVSSGSMALDLALLAVGIEPGDEVICPTLTFTATAEAIVHVGAIPIFVDIDKETYNIDTDQILKNITKKTKAIIVVHLYGQITNMDKMIKIAKERDLKIIEDSAQAHGATYKGKKSGSWGEVACFSFYPSKNLGCFGDGGAVVTNKKSVFEKINLLRNHGRTSRYDHKIVGYDARLDNLQAAVLRVKLNHLDQWNRRRREIASYFSKNLSNKYKTPFNPPESEHIYYAYTLQHSNRDKIIQFLVKNGVAAGIYYPTPLHLQKAYSDFKQTADFSTSENICKNIFSIPIFPELTNSETKYIIHILNKGADIK